LVPVYNRAAHVSQAIDSVLAQVLPDDELLVIDDGSTDQTPQVLASYGSRIKAIRQANHGPEVARNRASALAQGEYLVMLDSDDILLPGALETYHQIIQALDSPPLILGAMKCFRDGQAVLASTEARSPVEVLKYRDYLSKEVPIHMSNSRIVIRRAAFHEVGGYRNSSPTTFLMDDFDLVLRTGTCEPFVLVQKPYTVGYRQHPAGGHLNVPAMVKGILDMARSERNGRYPGGKHRRSARYGFIGGLSASFAFRHCWRRGFRRQAVQLLAGTAPMVLTAARGVLLRYLRKTARPIVLSPPDTAIAKAPAA
jgi:glycosyltransferase involved in cell wall biosynthesis